MGETSASEISGHFNLFPNEGGYGCSVQIDRFDNETLAKDEADRLSRTFSSVNDLSDGFESVSEKARYACRVSGLYVVQTGYSVSKASSQDAAIWEKLKLCVSVSEDKTLESLGEKWVAVQEIKWKGWVCNHPNNQLHVLCKNNMFSPTKPNQDSSKKYLLEIGDMQSSGFFYVKWDQQNLDISKPYEEHLNEIKADILNIEKKQSCERNIVFDQKQGWAFLRGNPYTLISLSGDGFLFGFALKSTHAVIPFNVNDYVKRVEWYKTSP